jgi:enterochelin esterase-like enzyme
MKPRGCERPLQSDLGLRKSSEREDQILATYWAPQVVVCRLNFHSVASTVYERIFTELLPLGFHCKTGASKWPVFLNSRRPLTERHHRIILVQAPQAGCMPDHAFAPTRGLLERWSFDSSHLANRLGDPTEREVLVHIPPEGVHAIDNGVALPVIIYLAPFTSSGPARAGWKAFAETIPQRHERLVKDGKMHPSILVMPDTFTSLGGNQFVNSPVLGQWSTWLSHALKPAIVERYATNGKFALVGKSSGGYGALVNAMLEPGCWDAIACHSGDVGFDMMFKPTFGETLTHVASYGSAAAYVAHVRQSAKLSGPDFHTLMICAMAASYDPRAPSAENPLGIELPVQARTGEIVEEAWNRWMEFDPLTMLDAKSKGLSDLTAAWIDCGDRDQYNIQYGSRAFVDKLSEMGIEHDWEEFSGSHSSIDHRLDLSLPFLSKSLQ